MSDTSVQLPQYSGSSSSTASRVTTLGARVEALARCLVTSVQWQRFFDRVAGHDPWSTVLNLLLLFQGVEALVRFPFLVRAMTRDALLFGTKGSVGRTGGGSKQPGGTYISVAPSTRFFVLKLALERGHNVEAALCRTSYITDPIAATIVYLA